MGKVILNSIAIAEEHRFSVANMARIQISVTDGCTRAYLELERRLPQRNKTGIRVMPSVRPPSGACIHRTNVLHRLAREVEVQSDDYS